MRIGIVTGEASGDLLGAALIEQLQKFYPNLTFDGVLGPRLKALGGTALYDSERLEVMGFIEPLKRLPELWRMYRHLCKHYRENPPDIFIGIDSPDFTLRIEYQLKRRGVKTVHYVSPSVWAWRQGRIKTIKKSVDLMLVLYPFEEAFYHQHHMPVVFVGHPMAMQIEGRAPLAPTQGHSRTIDTRETAMASCRGEWRSPSSKQTLAILPGSRHSEIANLTEPFLKAALLLKAHFPDLYFISPMVSPAIREHFLKIKALVAPDLDIELLDGRADEVLAKSDCALIAAGTAALQAMLHGCPMVVGYKVSAFNAWLIRKLYKQPFFTLPNILCGKRVIAEYFQEEVTPTQLFQSLKELLEDKSAAEAMAAEFHAMHQRLREPPSDVAAKAVIHLLNQIN